MGWLPSFRRPKEQVVREPSSPISIPSAPLMQPAGLPELNVVKYATENPSLSEELLKKYPGFNPQQITFSALTEVDLLNLIDEFKLYQDAQQNFGFKIQTFRPDLDKKRDELYQYANAIRMSGFKALGGEHRDRVFSSTNIQNTRIEAGGLQPTRGQERSGLAKIFLGSKK